MSSIMIADDEACQAMQIGENLESMGYSVVGTASSGESAVKLAEESRPDLIIMDIVMPGKYDGIDASEIITKKMDIPIIFLTSHREDRYIERMKNTHPYGFMLKPYEENQLRAAIEIAIQNKADERLLRDKIKPLQSMVEGIPDAFISINNNMSIVFWSRSAESVYGYQACDVLGKHIYLILAEASKMKLNHVIDYIIDTDESSIVFQDLKFEAVKMDGSIFPVEMTLSKCVINNSVHINCLARDMSGRILKDRKQADASVKNQKLFRMFYSNIKNIIDTIMRMIQLQSYYVSDVKLTEVLQNCYCRIQTMTILYEKYFLSEDLDRIGIYNFFKMVLRSLFLTYGDVDSKVSLEVDIDNEYLNFYPSIFCGLIVNELVTNCLKHAFPQGKSGVVRVEFKLDVGSNRNVLVVKDNGVGFPDGFDVSRADSFGLKFVSMLTGILNGKLEFNGERCSEFRVSF
jgi:PAS domain S-box-containing protein